MKRKIFFTIAAVLSTFAASAIIPQPRSVQQQTGVFVITPATTVVAAEGELAPLTDYFAGYVHIGRVVGASRDKNSVRLCVDPSLSGEAYRLTVSEEGIDIAGGSYGGVFNGIQTLFQLLPSGVYTHQCPLPMSVGCCTIEDAPQFSYRGFMLDVARTWSDADRVKRYIDLISYHKINKLHLHLCDDEGWRIEIKSHPELTGIGAWRGGSSPLRSVYGKWGELYGGCFSQQDMRDIIAYAAVRNVEIIPEIDLPGHSRTVANIHPEILCGYTPDGKATGGYEYRSAWCATREENYALLEDILGEICDLFPSEYIHIGGDEVDMSQWKKCPHCSAYAAEHCGNNFSRLQEVFMSRVSEMVIRHGKKPAVWNEAINGGSLSKESLVYGWESIKECQKAVGKGYETIVMPGQFFYLDMRQSKHEDGHTWAAIFDVEKCYSFDFEKQGITADQLKHIRGVEATFFSELYIAHNPENCNYLDYMLFPRLCAVAEIAWGKYGNSLDDFSKRLKKNHYDRMVAMGIHFRLSPPELSYADGRITASVDDGSTLFYTREGSDKWRPYAVPVPTFKPAEYIFRSEYGMAMSPETSLDKHYTRIYPPFKIKSSMPASASRGFSYAEGYKGISRTTRTPHDGDYIEFHFTQPLKCREVEFVTGYDHMQRHIFHSGYLEISADGVNFERVAELEGGHAKLTNPKPFKVARMVCTTDGNGTPYVIITAPRIKPIL